MRFAGALLVCALLAACTSSDGTTPTPSPPASTTATSTAPPTTPSSTPPTSPPRTGPLTTGPGVAPGAKPPVRAALSRQHTQFGAQAFAAYYFQAFDWDLATNDDYLVKSISAPECGGCQKHIASMEQLTRRHGVVRGGRINIVGTAPFRGTSATKADYIFDITVDQTAVVVQYPPAAPKTVQIAVKNFHSLVYVSWRGTDWKVIEVSKL